MIHSIQGKDFKGKGVMHRTSSVMENLVYDATMDEAFALLETPEAQMTARQLGFQSAQALFEHAQMHAGRDDSGW